LTSSPPPQSQDDAITSPSLAAVEAGRARVENHLEYFVEHLSESSKDMNEDVPRIDINKWADMYAQNDHEHGHHFVVHQHNHPVSGVHCKVDILR
jgi:hypothetical protein